MPPTQEVNYYHPGESKWFESSKGSNSSKAEPLLQCHSAALGNECRVGKLTLAFSKTVITPVPEEL